MSLQPFYPSLADLIDASAIPGDFQEFENFLNDGIDILLGKIWYKDLSVIVSPKGDTRYYNLTVLSKSLRLPVFGTGMNLVFFRDADVNVAAFPILFEWKWAIYKYINNLANQGFSYAPEAFINIFLELANIDSFDTFISEIIEAFLNVGDSDVSINFSNQLISYVNGYDNGTATVTAEIQSITTAITTIKDEVLTILDTSNQYTIKTIFDDYQNNTTLSTAVNTITTGLDNLDEDHDIYINFIGGIIESVLSDIDSIDEKFERLISLFEGWIEDITKEQLYELLVPQFSLELKTIAMALEFPRNWLVPVMPNPSNPSVLIENPDPNVLAGLTYTVGRLRISSTKGFEFENQQSLSFDQCMIGKTGIIVSFSNLKVDFSKAYNIPEADADGRPAEFMGVYCGDASVILPSKWFKNVDQTTAEVFGKNLLIGTGGVSGTFGLRAVGSVTGNNTLWANIGGSDSFRLGFRHFDIQFKQNKVISSNIKGAMEIKKFVYPAGTVNDQGVNVGGQTVTIGIAGHIHDDGDFNLTASAAPPYPIEFPNVFTYHIGSLELGKQDDDFYIGTSGAIEFKGFLKDTLKLKSIDIDRMRIYSDGTFEFEGGSINLIEPIVLPLGPVEITVTAIHYGSHQKEVDGVMRKYNYFGFDGGVSVDPLGVEVRGDGVKFYFCTDDLPNKPPAYLHIQTLYLDLTIPSDTPAVIFNGWLSIPEPGVSEEYAGGIKLQIPQAKISGSADMKLIPRYPAFIIDVSIDLPSPIPIGPVGIYGFRGLLGYRYVAEKEAAGLVSGVDSWYDYYKTPPRGIHVKKFNGPDKTKVAGTPFSIGAGASLGTSFDNGTVLNVKAMVLLSIPSLFMIDGRATILSARLGLDDPGDPPFFAFIAIGDNSFEVGFGADFKMPTKSGDILKLYADIQAGFFFDDSSKWYVNIGTKANPVTAKVLTLFNLTSYLMLSAKGIEAGARGEFDFRREYGPIKVHAWAYLEIGGKVSFEKPQFGAYLAAGIGADIDIKIISLYASFDVLFGVEAPKPFKIYGTFRLCVKVKILWVFSFKFCGELTLMWEFDKNVDTTPIDPFINAENQSTIPNLVQGVNMLSNETFELAYLGTSIPSSLPASVLERVIPLDTYIDIKTEKGFLPAAIANLIGGVNNPPDRYTELMPPKAQFKGKTVRQVKHQYSIESLSIKSWNPSINNWQDYNPYEAIYSSDPGINNLKVGQFQKSGNQYNAIRLLATTPFSYTEQGQPGWFIPEQYGITPASLFCEGEQLVPVCADFLSKPLGIKYYCYNNNQFFYSNQVAFLLLNKSDGDYAEVVTEPNIFGFTQSLAFQNRNKLQLNLPESSVEVTLKLSTYSSTVEISYYATHIDYGALTVPYGHPNPMATNPTEPYKVTVPASALNTPVVYNNPNWLPISRIEIQPVHPNQQAIDNLIQQIEAIEHDNNLILLQIKQGNIQSTANLEAQLNLLRRTGCSQTSDCNSDGKICDLMDQIINIKQTCLVDPSNYRPANNADYIGCINQIYQFIVHYLQQQPDPFLNQEIQKLMIFVQQANQSTYLKTWRSINNIITYLNKIGDCDCVDTVKCHTLLHEVCWLSLEQYQYNINIPGQAAIQADMQATVDAMTNYVRPIWRPDTHYVVHFQLKDTVNDGSASPGTFGYTYGFTTGGPLGFFHKHTKATYGDIVLDNNNVLEDANGILRDPSGNIIPVDPLNPLTPHPERYALTSLNRYIDYDRSYPNADGNLLSAKPLFYDDETTEISLFFTEDYVTLFFHNWAAYNGLTPAKGRIKIIIKDPREGTTITNPPALDYDSSYTNIPQTIENWQADPNPIVPHVFEQYANLIASNQCIPFGGNAIVPPSQYLNVVLKHLKPLKLYTAIVNNLYDLNKNATIEAGTNESVEIHKFTFQTSRYPNFEAQINSYLLKDPNDNSITKEAIFGIKKGFTSAEITAAYDTVLGNANTMSDDIAINYQHKFDRIIEGVLGLPPLAKAISTEFNIIRDSNDSDKIIAILIRNPEPFNNPKIPLNAIEDSIQVLNNSGNEDTNYKKIFSKDYAQVLIMHNSLGITGPLDFKFMYKIWNGSNYIVPSIPNYSTNSIGTIVVSNIDFSNV